MSSRSGTRRAALPLILAVTVTLPGAALGVVAFFGGLPEWSHPVFALAFGGSILGAAMLLRVVDRRAASSCSSSGWRRWPRSRPS